MKEGKTTDVSEIITAKEVSQILRIGRVKTYELMKSGEIQSFRVGERGVRTTRQMLENYIQQQLGKELN